MATNEIEIEVVLNAKDAEKGLASLEEGGEALGETFSGVGASISAIGGEMNERMGAVGETFGGVADAVMNLGSAVKGSQVSFLSLIGPIGLVTVALIEAYNAIESFFGTTKQREIKLKAYEISVAELTIILEELAAAQVTLTENEVERLRVMSQSAKEKIEEAQLIRESTTAIQEQIIKINEQVEALENLLTTRQAGAYAFEADSFDEIQHYRRLDKLLERRYALEQKINAENTRANKLVVEGAQGMAKVEALKEQHEKRSAKAVQERAKTEANMATEARIKELQAQEQTEKTKTEIAKLEAQRRYRELSQLEDVSQDAKDRAVLAENKALKYRLKQIAEEERKAQRLKQKQAAALRRMAAVKRLAEEQKTQAELARIRRAEIENMELTGADRLEVLGQQQALELELAGNNARAREAIALEFENRRLVIQQEAERKRQEAARKAAEEEKQRDEQRRALRFDSMQFDLEMMRDGLDKEVALLELRYRREIELTATTEEEKVELQRRAEIERAKIIEEGMTNQLNAIAETTSALGAGFAESAYGALLMGESFKKSIGQIITGLGKQAAVESLMELAKGTAALFLNPAVAGQHFAASAMFATAAGVAGSVGSALGGGGGGGGGAVASTSPTGSPQSAPAPERERAESSAMVFNINFGNSTIYDTKRAAQDAMASEIMRTINRQRRGAPRFAMG
jgi:hypothetical protein